MTNYEVYKEAIITQLGTGDCDLYKIALAEKNKNCGNVTCRECRELTADWLAEEYKETDWSKVEVDTPVLVSDNGEYWCNKHFAKYKNGTVCTWRGGCTSWSATDNEAIVAWRYAKLYKGENNENY